jgi:hypothetical protein
MAQRRLAVAFLVLGSLAIPALAQAQSAIAGVVRDTSGAVLPGVTVEASSPVLIEKVKVAVTNESGQYRIVDLRPGLYSVSFKLTGFSTIVRDGIALEANFTAPINVELRVGALEESITVTGESPVVDVQTSSRREVVSQELIESLPTGRNFQLIAGTVPAVSTGVFDVGGSSSMWTGGSLLVHGSQSRDSRTMIDGMVADAMFGGGQCSCTYDNEAQTQEMAVQVSGGSAENQTAGVLVNRVPRTGGNTFSGEFVGLFSNDRLQSDNLSDDLRARGLRAGDQLSKLYDINYSLGGPIMRDKLWFFMSGRNWAYNNFVAGAFNPDGSQAVDDNVLKSFPARLTWQATRNDRVTAMFDWANKVRGHRDLNALTSPEASIRQSQPAQHVGQVKWTSALSSKLLFEAGYTNSYNGQFYQYRPEVLIGNCHVAFALCPAGTSYGDIPKQDTLLGTRWNAAIPGAGTTAPAHQPSTSHVVVGSMSYVTGAHNFKVGVQDRWGWSKDIRSNVNGDIIQQYRNGQPFAAVLLNTPLDNRVDVNADFGFFVQDAWTLRRVTLSPGLRYDYFNSSVPAQSVAAGRFVPARTFEEIRDVPNWSNISPRMGAAWDVFGDGRTAIRANVGLYVQSEGPGFASTYNPQVFASDSRTWSDPNGDDIAQENELGPTNNLNFGVRRNQNADPDIERPYQWVTNIGIQRELMPGFAVGLSFNRRTFHELIWTDNLAISHDDYTLLSVPDPRNNGQTLPVYNLNRAKQGLVDELDTNASDNTRAYNGFDVSFNMRTRGGGNISGGTSTGRTTSATCQVEDPNNLRFCDQGDYDVPMRTQFKLSATYPLWYGLRLSGTFQSQPGGDRGINYQVTRTLIPTLTQTTVNVRLNDPGSEFNDRVNQLDFSLSKSFRRAGIEVRPELALFNLLNASAVLSQVNTFGPALGNVNTVLQPRLARLGLTMRF